MLAWFIFANVCNSLENNESFLKSYENSLRFKGTWWESPDENHKKGATTTNNTNWNLIVFLWVLQLKHVYKQKRTAPEWEPIYAVHLAQQ